jgi:thioredoxin
MNPSEFQQKISETEKPIVVDFWAPWCVPCRVTKPILEKLAQEYGGRVAFIPVDADTSREVLQQYRVIGIPTVLTLRGGKEVGRVTGARNETDYRAMFHALAEDRQVKNSLSSFDRMLRLGAGMMLVIAGISTGSWLAAIIGGIVAFMGMYDRCPVWRSISGYLFPPTPKN